jgi:hypothetical protein
VVSSYLDYKGVIEVVRLGLLIPVRRDVISVVYFACAILRCLYIDVYHPRVRRVLAFLCLYVRYLIERSVI